MTEAAQWRAAVGQVWAAEWQRTHRSFAGVAAALDAAILAAAPASGSVLDIGCGAGSTSLALAAARPDLAIVGVDLSPELVAVARERGAGVPNARFAEADASASPSVDGGYAMAVSRHGVMFFADPDAAFTAIRARMAPAAPLVFSCFRSVADNAWASAVVEAITGAPMTPAGDIPGPFAFADPEHVAALLARTGWQDARPQPLDYRYVAGEGTDPVADALGFLARIGPGGRAMATLPEHDRPAARIRLRALLERHAAGDAVTFPAAAWIWSATA